MLYNDLMHPPRKASILPVLNLLMLFFFLFPVSCAWPAPAFSGLVRGTRSPAPQEPSTPDPTPLSSSPTPASPASQPLPGDPTALPLTPDLQPSPEPLSSSHTKYILTARFDNALHYLSVEENVIYTNTVGASLSNLVFVVEPNRYPGAFRLISLAWGDGKPIGSHALDVNRLEIPLAQSLQPGNSVRLSLSYEIFLPPIPPPSNVTRPVPFGYTARQTNIVDWYPFLPPYRAEKGWLIHDPWYYGEHQVYDIADYQVNLQVSSEGSQLILAASAPAEQEGEWLRYRLEKARSFSLSSSSDYVVFTQKVGEITVLSYAFPFHQDAGRAALQETAAALKLYSELFGSYSHSSLSVVEADFLDGMEYEGLYFLSRGFYNLYDGTHRGYLTTIAVHETAHQWWYGKVGNDQALEPWLDEAMATYSEKLFYEHTYPDLVDWWWAFRVNYYQPSGQVNGRINDYNGFRPYVNAVYLRGALFLEDLRKTIGDEAFFAFLKDYASRKTLDLATSADFFTILAEHTSTDISKLKEEYFR